MDEPTDSLMKLKNETITPSIFEEQISRKPNRYPWTDTFIEAMHNGFWTDKEFNFKSDIHQFTTKLTEQERQIIVRTLSAIGQIEVAVKTFWAKLGENLPHPSLQDLGYVMANVEVIHNNAYERLLKVLDLEDIFEENLKLEWIQGRVKYLRKYTHRFYKDSKKQYLYALILFTLFVENVSLFSQFYVINWFGRFKNVLKDTNQQVMYTRNEENIHALVGIKIINTIREEHPELFDDELIERIKSEAVAAFEAESKIVDWMVNGIDEEGLTAEILKEFIKNRINSSLEQIGFPKVFEIDAELLKESKWFEEELLANNMTDFFHGKPTEYSKRIKVSEKTTYFNMKRIKLEDDYSKVKRYGMVIRYGYDDESWETIGEDERGNYVSYTDYKKLLDEKAPPRLPADFSDLKKIINKKIKSYETASIDRFERKDTVNYGWAINQYHIANKLRDCLRIIEEDIHVEKK